MRTLAAWALVLTVLFNGAAAPGPAGGDTPGAGRADDATTLTFPQSGGSDTSFKLSAPQRAIVLSAKFDLEGLPDLGPLHATNYDFTDTVNNQAWEGTLTAKPPAGAPGSYQTTAFQAGDYPLVSTNDGNTKDSIQFEMPYHLFRLKVKEQVVQGFTVTWMGSGYAADLFLGTEDYGADVYVWNSGVSRWEDVGSTADQNIGTVTRAFAANPGGYLDAGGNLYVMAVPVEPAFAFFPIYYLWTDYVSLSVTGQNAVWPAGPALDIGDNGDNEWSYTGVFRSHITVSDEAVAQELQSLIDEQGGGNSTFDVPFRFTSTSGGKLTISNISIEYDRPPVYKVISDTYAFDEDTLVPVKLIDLNTHFSDDRDGGKLRYIVTAMEDRAKVEATVDADGHSLDFRAPTKNWYGTRWVGVSATDSNEQTTASGQFKVSVRPVNDPPVLKKPGSQTATQGKPFSLVYTATDPDPGDSLAFSDNTPLFTIDPKTGKVAFTPNNSDVGAHRVRITVTDLFGAEDFEEVTWTILNVNDPPEVDTNQSDIDALGLVQGTPVEFTVTAHDIDTRFGDAVTFSDNTSLFNINAATGVVSFTPGSGDVGEHIVRMTVTDRSGATGYKDLLFTIANINDPPVIPPIEDQVATQDQFFEYTVNASDPDLPWGDAITFEDNTTLFNIGKFNGTVAFTPNNSAVGMQRIKITVKDRSGYSASAVLNLTVLNVNDPPEGLQILAPLSNSTAREGERVRFAASARDPDGDVLNFTWKEGVRVMGYGPELSAPLPVGTHTITLEVTDGKAQATAAVTVSVKPRASSSAIGGGTSAALWGAGILAVLLLGGAFFYFFVMKKREPERTLPPEEADTPVTVGPHQYQPYQPPAPLYPVEVEARPLHQPPPAAPAPPPHAERAPPRKKMKMKPVEARDERVELRDVKRRLTSAEDALRLAKDRGLNVSEVEELVLAGKRHAYRAEYRQAMEALQRAQELTARLLGESR